ncbi:MAG: HEAT repeat domain-containing protein [Acidobacteria bacterium]|nr:MAG: HEAT repeat domain-containing protein [Acidobacteriota bacterium]REK06122.1 MAG: HEAT repeat domain-containing protein [Acidobacteriota bacterium]
MSEKPETAVGRAKTVLGLVAALGTFATGLGVVAFVAGYQALRAQYSFLQVPFVFVDYWAYAETGFAGITRSVLDAARHPLGLLTLFLSSVGIVLLLEWKLFRRLVDRADVMFVFSLLMIGLTVLLVRQQLVVQDLTRSTSTLSTQGEVARDPAISVPAKIPFSLGMDKAFVPPAASDIQHPATSFEFWERLAEEIEETTASGSPILPVRTPPSWIYPAAINGDHSVIGVASESQNPFQRRSEKLYARLCAAAAVVIWGVFVLGQWTRRVRRTLDSPAERSRLSEELWFATRHICVPLLVLLVTVSLLHLMPQSYGLLAVPSIGHEYVEISQAHSGGAGDEDTERRQLNERIAGLRTALDEEEPFLLDVAAEKVLRHARAHSWAVKEIMDAVRTLPEFEELDSPEGRGVRGLYRRLSEVNRGFILHYPRSQEGALRLLQRSSDEAGFSWQVRSYPSSSVSRVSVIGDPSAARIIEILRQLRLERETERIDLLYEAETLGHDRLLEIAIGGTLDESPAIRAFSATDIGRFSLGLEDSPGDRLRRRLGWRKLLEIARNRAERSDIRGAAATALAMVGLEEGCLDLVELAEEEDDESDPYWHVRGTVMTTMARMGCRDAAPYLMAVSESSAPPRVMVTVPSTLITTSTLSSSIGLLGEFVMHGDDHDLVGTALTALAALPRDSHGAVLDAGQLVADFLDFAAPSFEGRARVQLMGAAVAVLRSLGSSEAVRVFESMAGDEDLHEEVRVGAIVALQDQQVPSSEDLLLRIAQNRENSRMVRKASLLSLSFFDKDSVSRSLCDAAGDDSDLIESAVAALRKRAESGSSVAKYLADECGRMASIPTLSEIMERRGVDLLESQAEEVPASTSEEGDIFSSIRSVSPRAGSVPVDLPDEGQPVLLQIPFTPGSLVSLRTDSNPGVDPAFVVFDEAGNVVATDDDSGGGLEAQSRFVASGAVVVSLGGLSGPGRTRLIIEVEE